MGKTYTAVFLWAKVLFCLRIVASYPPFLLHIVCQFTTRLNFQRPTGLISLFTFGGQRLEKCVKSIVQHQAADDNG